MNYQTKILQLLHEASSLAEQQNHRETYDATMTAMIEVHECVKANGTTSEITLSKLQLRRALTNNK